MVALLVDAHRDTLDASRPIMPKNARRDGGDIDFFAHIRTLSVVVAVTALELKPGEVCVGKLLPS
jgi:hypothetical protein